MERDKISDCEVCGGSNYTLAEGLYFCEECGTQNKFAREVVYDHREEFRTKAKIQIPKSSKQNIVEKKLTSFEESNYYLLGMLNEIMDIDECSPTIKMTTLQIWMAYLKETEIAFFSPVHPDLPKLFVAHSAKDAEILYGIKNEPKKRKRYDKKKVEAPTETQDFTANRRKIRKSEVNLSRMESESAKNSSVSGPLSTISLDTLLSTNTKNFQLKMQYSKGSAKIFNRLRKTKLEDKDAYVRVNPAACRPTEGIYQISPLLLVSLLYCALRVDNCDIQLSDLIRFIREGNLTYMNLKLLLPEEYQNDAADTDLHLPNYSFMRMFITNLGQLVPGLMSSMCEKPPDMLKLCKRYMQELNLPEDLVDYVDKLLVFLPPNFNHPGRTQPFHNFEGRAMAYIIFVLKLIFGLDDEREIQMSRAARETNKIIVKKNIEGVQMSFEFESWREFIEYRKFIMVRFYFPLIFAKENQNKEMYPSYIAFLDSLRLKENCYEKSTKKKGYKQFEQNMRIRGNAKNILMELIKKHNTEQVSTNEVTYVAFKPTLTPYSDYLSHIIEQYGDKLELNKKILQKNHQQVSIKNFLTWRPFVEKLQTAGLNIHVQKSKISKNLEILSHEKPTPKPHLRLSHKIKFEKWKKYVENRDTKRAVKKRVNDTKTRGVTVDKILEQREYWRMKIKKKRIEDKSGGDGATVRIGDTNLEENFDAELENLEDVKPIQPLIYKEATALCDLSSDSDFDEEDIWLEESSTSTKKLQATTKASETLKESSKPTVDLKKPHLNFFLPDFNYWHRHSILSNSNTTAYDFGRHIPLEEFPKSYQWILETCASMIHMCPKLLHIEIMMIEYCYLYELKPLELIENVLKFQTPKDHKFRFYKQTYNASLRKRI